MARLSLLTALTSACLALATPTLTKKQNALTPVTQDFYDTLVYYGNFAAAAIPSPCAVPPHNSVVLNYLQNSTTDTQATLFRQDSTRQLIISYRGSSDLQDFLTDFSFFPVTYPGCTGCMVHVGFYTAWQSIKPQSMAALDAALAANPGYSIVIVGHSLGGALSNLAWTDLVSSGKYPSITKGWSYGEPRVGNQPYADYVDSLSHSTDLIVGNFYRVTHYNDGVPQLPAMAQGFEHHRTEIWASMDQSNAATTYICQGQENPNCNDGAGGVFINEAHINYPGINYLTACTASQ